MDYDEEFNGAIGIDLGTTYSCVAVYHNDRVEVIPNDQGNRTTPSCVAFYHDEVLVGDSAKNLAARGVPYVVYDAKRMIGARFDDATLQSDMKHWPFTVRRGRHDKVEIEVDFRGETLTLAPEQISAKVLSYLKECAERYLGKRVTKTVVTVPAYFNDSQRQATKDAGMIAGLDVLRIINEPTAAALCYGLGLLPHHTPHINTNDSVERAPAGATESTAMNIVVFDLGGGTFDVTVVTVDAGTFAVRATAGDTHLGGQDIDTAVLQYLAHDLRTRHGLSLESHPRWLAKARAACEKVKRVLSFANSEELTLEGILPREEDYSLTLSRAKLEEICAPVLTRCAAVMQRALRDARLTPAEADAVILVGGSSRIPRVQSMLRELFSARRLSNSVHPDEAVAIGAAVQASILYDSGASCDFPRELTTSTTTDSVLTAPPPPPPPSRTVGVLLMDVLPLSIGVEVDHGKFDVIIPRNTTIPYRATKDYSTVEDNQREVDIVVYEGEGTRTRQNHKLGDFSLEGITPARRGEPTIRVTFSVDADGVLTITAAELRESDECGGSTRQTTTGMEKEEHRQTKTLVVQNAERLSAEEVAAMVATAEKLSRRRRRSAEDDEDAVGDAESDRDCEDEDEDEEGKSREDAARRRRRRRSGATTKRRQGGGGDAPAESSASSAAVSHSTAASSRPSLAEVHREAAAKLQHLMQRLDTALQSTQTTTDGSTATANRSACAKLLRQGQEWVAHRLTHYTHVEELEKKVHKIQRRLHRAIRMTEEGGGGHGGDDSANDDEEEETESATVVKRVRAEAEAEAEGVRDEEEGGGAQRSSRAEEEGSSHGSNHEAAAPEVTATVCQTDVVLS